MAEIVNSLFGLSPMQVRQQQDLENQAFGSQIAQSYFDPTDRENAYRGAMVGNAIAKLGGSLFGLQTPELKRATELESILQQTIQEVGSQDPAQLYPVLANRLGSAGYGREAMQVGQIGQKAVQEAQLSQATIAEKQASAVAKNREKLGAFAQTLLSAGLQPGSAEWNQAMKDKIEKETYIPEKTVTPQNEAEKAILNKYKQLYPDNPELASKAFLEYLSTIKQKEVAAGKPDSQTPAIDISRLDNSFKEFITPNKEKLGSINEALKLAEQALTNPQAGVQLNALLASLYQGGRLSNQDISRTANAGSLPAQVIQNFNKIISGTDTETNIADKVKLLKSLQEGTANSLNQSVDAWAERWQTAPGVSKETIDTYTKGAKFRKKDVNKPKTADEYLKGL